MPHMSGCGESVDVFGGDAAAEAAVAPSDDAGPPAPSEMEQLHALGDKKFGRGRTAGRRPPQAAAAGEASASAKPAARRQSSGYGKLNPNSIGGRPQTRAATAAAAQAESEGGVASGSDRSTASADSGTSSGKRSGSRSPAPRRPNVKNVASSGYGQRSRSASPAVSAAPSVNNDCPTGGGGGGGGGEGGEGGEFTLGGEQEQQP